MVAHTLRRLTTGARPVVALFLLLLASLYLMSEATRNSAEFGRIYSALLAVNILALLLLVALIGRHLVRLIRHYRHNAPGSRLTARLVVMFTVLAVAPVSVVYYFSLEFLHRGIDSWFDVRIEQALEDALELGRRSLDDRLSNLLRQTRQQAEALGPISDDMAALRLNELRQKSGAVEITLLTMDGRVVASSSTEPAQLVPAVPGNAVLAQLRQGLDYAGLDPQQDRRLEAQIAFTVASAEPGGNRRAVHAIFPIAERLGELAESVQAAFAQYKELAFLRRPLKYSFTLTLSLVLLLSLLTAVWAAFFSARRLVAPIRDLAEGTRAVAAGDYDMRLPLPGRDELGFLVRSFNEMTRKIALSRDQARRSQEQVEAQRAYLEVVLDRLSSGVFTLDDEGRLRTVNRAGCQLLAVPLETFIGEPLGALARRHAFLEPLVEALLPHLHRGAPEWREEVALFGSTGRQVLMCRGSSLCGARPSPVAVEAGFTADDLREGGHVVVFDDITALIQAQRDAAWGEVARRLAHEIKNPLTPIQLSAERLRRKYLTQMDPEDAEVLDRATRTIIQQVETMQEMVKAFSDYARAPELERDEVDLNTVVSDVLELYRGGEGIVIALDLDPELPPVAADAGRLRQLLHNLVKNALETGGHEGAVRLEVGTRCEREAQCRYVELRLRDNGPGFPEAVRSQLFEPYVTTKPKGTGLGLAIVKKIVEEHGGVLQAENAPDGGAQVTIRLPARAAVRNHIA